jgi:hypothetical protein
VGFALGTIVREIERHPVLYTATINDSALVSACEGAYVQIADVASQSSEPAAAPHAPLPIFTRADAPDICIAPSLF